MANSNRQNLRSLIYYLGLLLIFGAGISLILAAGSRLQRNSGPDTSGQSSTIATNSTTAAPASSASSPGTILPGPLRSPIGVLLLQIVVIIVVARMFGAVFRRLGQPPVMGEMVAGIALGPSVLGLVFPQTLAFLFPASAR